MLKIRMVPDVVRNKTVVVYPSMHLRAMDGDGSMEKMKTYLTIIGGGSVPPSTRLRGYGLERNKWFWVVPMDTKFSFHVEKNFDPPTQKRLSEAKGVIVPARFVDETNTYKVCNGWFKQSLTNGVGIILEELQTDSYEPISRAKLIVLEE